MKNGSSLRILVVEDDEDHTETVLRSLEDSIVDTDVHAVADGEAALDYLLGRGRYSAPGSCPRPAVVLLDLRLPKVDGLEVLRTIRASEGLASVAVVILSTSEAERDADESYSLGADGYLVKCLDFEAFVRQTKDLGVILKNFARRASAERSGAPRRNETVDGA